MTSGTKKMRLMENGKLGMQLNRGGHLLVLGGVKLLFNPVQHEPREKQDTKVYILAPRVDAGE